MRALLGIGLSAAALMRAGICSAAAEPPASGADTGYANYGFASELGTGVYEINGSTIQVYGFTPGYRLRDAQPDGGRPGIRLIFPVTVGFFDFQLQDLAHLEVPRHIGALSLEPGVELDWWLHENWHVYPYLKGGASFASSEEANAYIWAIGARSDYRFSVLDGPDLWRADLTHAQVHYPAPLADGTTQANDSFTRLRNGVELRRSFGAAAGRRFELGVYGVSDIYFDAPHGPQSGISAKTLQFEGGLMFGANPMYQVWGIPLPRLGIGYRSAGVLSGWRLVLGDPF